MLQRLRLNKLAHHVYYGYLHGFDTANRHVLPALEKCLALAKSRKTTDLGDYHEYGVFKGYAFWYAQQTANRLELTGMRFFGMDSFRGLPKVEGCDATNTNDFYEGQYACSKSSVVRHLDERQVDWSRTYLIDGFFQDTLKPETRRRYGMRPIAVGLIDCDLYASTREVLHFIDPLLMDGSILLFDDWNCFGAADDKGQRRALREFLAGRRDVQFDELFAYGSWGQVFTVRKTGSGSTMVH